MVVGTSSIMGWLGNPHSYIRNVLPLFMYKRKVSMARVIVCAALKLKNGLVLPSVRHYDMLNHHIIDALKNTGAHKSGDVVQGFVDNMGEFHTREDALVIAVKAGQVRNKTQPFDKLFSEDLY